jgi:hypothetical protein
MGLGSLARINIVSHTTFHTRQKHAPQQKGTEKISLTFKNISIYYSINLAHAHLQIKYNIALGSLDHSTAAAYIASFIVAMIALSSSWSQWSHRQ